MKSVSLLFTLALLLCVAGFPQRVQATEKSSFQVIIEGGLALPYGNLADDFHATPLGFGATSGYEGGFRVRFHLSESLSLSPAFHFLNPGDFSSENDEYGEYSLQANSYRYTIEMMLAKVEPRFGIQPFLACGMGLFRNRYQGFTKPFVQEFDRSVNTLGFSARVGFRVNEFELSCVYNINRFNSYQFFDGDYEFDYNWDTLVFRLGWIIPFSND